MKGRSALLRALWIAALSFGLGGVAVAAEPTAKAAPYENLMVPSPSMGRDIPVAFLAGGPHAVYLLDAFNAGPDVSNWVTAGNAMNTLAGKGISVVAPAGGAYSMYTNWEQDGSKQWDTFLSAELPDWLAANRGLAPVAMRPLAPLRAVTGRWRWRPSTPTASASLARCRALYPSNTTTNGAIAAGMQQFGGVDTNGMWGAPQLGRWKWHDPWVHASLLAQNNTRVWVWSPTNPGASDPAAMIGQAAEAMGNSRMFYNQYRSVGGHNGHFDFPASGDNGWGSWAPQLGAMSGDIVGAIR